MIPVPALDAVLFDLDGTLVDSAPDLIAALNRLRATLGYPAMPAGPLRAVAGKGAAAILAEGLPELNEQQRDRHTQQFLDDYHHNCWDQSHCFSGIEDILDSIEQNVIPWGVVTNKVMRLAAPVVTQAGWETRAACLIAGDSTPNPKPAPDPLLAACRQLNVNPANVLYIGDDLRDVQASGAAGCLSGAAHWGYIPDSESAKNWPADFHFETPTDVLNWLQTV